MPEEFSTKDRKKEFDKIFKEKIVLFFKTKHFEVHSTHKSILESNKFYLGSPTRKIKIAELLERKSIISE